MNQINPKMEAGAYNITAKCSMETASAREADCFTTVSRITADEATVFLGRSPDVVTPNGLDMRVIPDYSAERTFRPGRGPNSLARRDASCGASLRRIPGSSSFPGGMNTTTRAWTCSSTRWRA